MHGDIRNVYTILVGKLEWKRPHSRTRHRWEANTKVDLQGIGYEGVNWIHLAQDRVKKPILVKMI
jgi:hypothetical protein